MFPYPSFPTSSGYYPLRTKDDENHVQYDKEFGTAVFPRAVLRHRSPPGTVAFPRDTSDFFKTD
jgi:hypothetical protein